MPYILFVIFSFVFLLGSLALTAMFSILYAAEEVAKESFYFAGAFVLVGICLVVVSVRLLKASDRGACADSRAGARGSQVIGANEELRIAAPWVLPVACFPVACLVAVAVFVRLASGAAPSWSFPAIAVAALIPIYIASVKFQLWRYGAMQLRLEQSPVVLQRGLEGQLSLGRAVAEGRKVDVDLACVKTSWQTLDRTTARRRITRYATDIWNARDLLPATVHDGTAVVKLSLQFPANLPATSYLGMPSAGGSSREHHRWELRVDLRPAGTRMLRTFQVPVTDGE